MTLPLHGLRVIELTDGLGESTGRYLADLGAEVIKVEPPAGAASRRTPPVIDGVSIPFALRNANKLGITLDLDQADGQVRLRVLAATADILVESRAPGWLAGRYLGPDTLTDINPALVWVSISPFGQNGPYREWAATEPVLYALSGALSRSGLPGAEPLLPPAGLVEETVGAHAAWCALLAYYHRLRTGQGQVVDLSAFEAMVHGFDPGFGVQGSAAAGRSADFPRGRPDAAHFYPVFRCRDGQVRVCLLAKRQWRGMFGWLGEPAEFADPPYDTIPGRYAAADQLYPLIARLFAPLTRQEIVAEGARRGVPVGGVLDLAEVLTAEHFVASGALVETEIAPGLRARVPSGCVSDGGVRAGFRTRAPQAGEHNHVVLDSDRPAPPAVGTGAVAAPFEGLRVLDLGVIVFGAELGRQFADHGADVIKVENVDFPDGLRQSRRGSALSASVAWGHRNKRSIGLNLRSADGKRVFQDLAAQADIVLANFKPGTLAAMGLDHAGLSAINPRLIMLESSAFGSTGPWHGRLGYGPLVRASCGVSTLWRYPDDEERLCDGLTVYPDHVAAQVAAVAVVAALVRRLHTREGAELEVAQADVALVQLGPQVVGQALGLAAAPGNADPFAAPSGVFPCAGDDEWCAITVRDDQDWARLCTVAGRPELADDPDYATAEARISNRERVDAVLAAWTRTLIPTHVMTTLQDAGVPAGAMRRLPELLSEPQLLARRAFTTLEHDLLPDPLPTVATVGHFGTIPDPPLRQAPQLGQQTAEVCASVLGLSAERISALSSAGALHLPAEDAR